MKNNQKSFTLAETMIVVAVLGLIASLVVPQIVKRHIEISNKTKIKKSMAAYDFLINKMVLENDTRDALALQSWAGNAENGCENSTTYFKKSEGSGCRFKTTDGVWWDISDIMYPTIALKEADLDNENSAARFKLIAHFDAQGILRVDDLQYEELLAIKSGNEEYLKELEKLYGVTPKNNFQKFLAGYYDNLSKYITEKCSDSICSISFSAAGSSFKNYKNYKNCYCKKGASMKPNTSTVWYNSYLLFDNNGNIFMEKWCTDETMTQCMDREEIYEFNDEDSYKYYFCPGNSDKCTVKEQDYNSTNTLRRGNCDKTTGICDF